MSNSCVRDDRPSSLRMRASLYKLVPISLRAPMHSSEAKHVTAVVALVSMFVEASRMGEVLEALSKIDNIEEFREVTGDFDILSLVACADMEDFRDVLKNRIQKIPGVRNTISSIVLETHKVSKVASESTGPILGPTLGSRFLT